jgi:flagellar basal body-associated protein FliL
MDVNQSPSKRTVWVVIGIAVAAFVIMGLILYILFGGTTNEESNGAGTATTEPVATEEQVRQNLDDLTEARKQADEDIKTAEDAMKDDTNQIKVGS